MLFFVSNGFQRAKQAWRWLEVFALVWVIFEGMKYALLHLLTFGRQAMFDPALIADVYLFSAVVICILYVPMKFIKKSKAQPSDLVSILILTLALPVYVITVLAFFSRIPEWEDMMIIAFVAAGELFFYIPNIIQDVNRPLTLPEISEEHPQRPESQRVD